MYVMCVCLLSALSRRVGALQISIIIIFFFFISTQVCTESYSAVTWCHVKHVCIGKTFCVHHTTMHHIMVSLRNHIIIMSMVYVCLAVTCHLLLGQNYRDLLHATAKT